MMRAAFERRGRTMHELLVGDPRRHLPRARRAPSTASRRSRACSAARSAVARPTTTLELADVRAVGGQGGHRARRGVRRARATRGCRSRSATTTWSRASRGSRSSCLEPPRSARGLASRCWHSRSWSCSSWRPSWRSSRSPEPGDDAGAAATAGVGTGGTFDQRRLRRPRHVGRCVRLRARLPERGPVARRSRPDDVDTMAGLGVKTLYLQAARLDDRSPDGIVDARPHRPLPRARPRPGHPGGGVVPARSSPPSTPTSTRLRQIADFEWNGHRFDGITVDIEDIENVPDVAERNTRLIELSRRLRDAARSRRRPSAPRCCRRCRSRWSTRRTGPAFPWTELAPYYDVWLPMAYWSFRNEDSGYKDGYTLRGGERAPPAGQPRRARRRWCTRSAASPTLITEGELRDYLRALTDTDALGGSIYDYRTMNGGHWGVLRGTEAALAAPPASADHLGPDHPGAAGHVRSRCDDRAVRRDDCTAGDDGGPSGRHDGSPVDTGRHRDSLDGAPQMALGPRGTPLRGRPDARRIPA